MSVLVVPAVFHRDPPPARVLLAIDLSASMDCALTDVDCPSDTNRPLKDGDPRQRRIDTARDWAASGAIAYLREPDDELGLWGFGSNCLRRGAALIVVDRDCGRSQQKRPKPPIGPQRWKLQEIARANNTPRGRDGELETHAGRVREDVKALNAKTTGGGTPLYDMIVEGVAELKQAGPSDAIRSLVILTDGLENQIDPSVVEAKLGPAAAAPDNKVRVIITATKDLCRILKPQLKPFDGACFEVTSNSKEKLQGVLLAIGKLLRKPYP